MAILAPLAVTDLRAGFSTQLFAVDASDWGEAVVSSEVGPHMGRELHRHGLRRSVWTKDVISVKRMLRRLDGLMMLINCQKVKNPFLNIRCGKLLQKGWIFVYVRNGGLNEFDTSIWERFAATWMQKRLLDLIRVKAPHVGDIRVPILADSQVSLGAIAKAAAVHQV